MCSQTAISEPVITWSSMSWALFLLKKSIFCIWYSSSGIFCHHFFLTIKTFYYRTFQFTAKQGIISLHYFPSSGCHILARFVSSVCVSLPTTFHPQIMKISEQTPQISYNFYCVSKILETFFQKSTATIAITHLNNIVIP